jgi:negative regulator of sigma-B (phosphoserine phosphatase)
VPDRASPNWPSRLERGVAERALRGEHRSGDRAVLAAYQGGALVAAIDGLGHGSDAADAAAVAAQVLAARPDDEPAHLLDACHEALIRTRGAVMTLAWFDLDDARLSWTGVGNVEGRLVHAGTPFPTHPGAPTEGALTKGGVVGYNLPPIRVTSADLLAGDVMVLATDGIDSGFAQAIAGGGTAQDIADRILAEHGKEGDDALVVVVRYLGGG